MRRYRPQIAVTLIALLGALGAIAHGGHAPQGGGSPAQVRFLPQGGGSGFPPQGFTVAGSTPATIYGSDLALWLDASDSGTVTEAGSGVSNWADKSTFGNDVAQATDADRPAYGDAAVNGLNAVLFDDENTEYLEGAFAPFSDYPLTIFVVAVRDEDSTDLQTTVCVKGDDYNYHAANMLGSGLGYILSYEARSTTVGANAATTSSGWTTNATHLIGCFGSTSTNRSVEIDAGSTGTTSTDCSPLSLSTTRVGRFLSDGNVRYFSGYVCEVVIATSVDSEKAAATEAYLADKWGVTIP